MVASCKKRSRGLMMFQAVTLRRRRSAGRRSSSAIDNSRELPDACASRNSHSQQRTQNCDLILLA